MSVGETLLVVVPSFCYLGDMLNAGGGCDLAIIVRCQTAWGKFRRLLPLLTSRHLSLMTRGRLYSSCVRSTMLYGSETWATTRANLQRLERNDGCMVRWICGMQDTHTNELRDRMGIKEVSEVLRARRLRWFGHTQRATSCINTIIGMPIPGPRRPGGQNKSWLTCVKEDQRV